MMIGSGCTLTRTSRPSDNDRLTVDFSGAYFAQIGNWPDHGDQGANTHDRVFEDSGYVVNCVSGSSLIANCGESITVTPAQTGRAESLPLDAHGERERHGDGNGPDGASAADWRC